MSPDVSHSLDVTLTLAHLRIVHMGNPEVGNFEYIGHQDTPQNGQNVPFYTN